MRPVHRWGIVAVGVALAVGVPFVVRALPVPDRSVTASRLLSQVRSGLDTPYTGTVESRGALGLPIADHFTDVADLLGGTTRMRVWWRDAGDWRVDKLLDTGEVDLFHHGRRTTEWDYERSEARSSVDPPIRLPRDADLLPPALARRALDGAAGPDVQRIAPRRVAGVDALGLRVVPTDPRTSISHVDLWVDPADGLVLEADVYGAGSRPVLTSAFSELTLGSPAASATTFQPAPGLRESADDVLDIADAANQYAPVSPPATVAGLPRSTSSRGAVGVYGTGLTQLMAVPLQQHDAYDLAGQLTTAGARLVGDRPLLRVGPLGVIMTVSHQPFDFAWLVTGTVTDRTLVRAADDLVTGTRFR